MVRSFALPSGSISTSGFLPCLEELDLEGCNLSDLMLISSADSDNTSRTSEPIIITLAKLFPSLQTLNLSYNALSNSSLTPEALGMIILKFPAQKMLHHPWIIGSFYRECTQCLLPITVSFFNILSFWSRGFGVNKVDSRNTSLGGFFTKAISNQFLQCNSCFKLAVLGPRRSLWSSDAVN